MKNILIFGGTGVLGNEFNHYLLRKKIIVNNYKNTQKIKKKLNPVKFFLNKKNLSNFIETKNINCIINFAAITNIEKCEKFKKESYKVNTKLPIILAKICKEKKIFLIHISTDHFLAKKIPIAENSKLCTTNYYAYTKLLAEKYIKKVNCNYIILRTNFFGKTILKQTFSDKIIDALKKKKKIFLFEDVYFNPINIQTLCVFIYRFIKKPIKGIFNLSSDQLISKYKFGKIICKNLKLNEKLINKIKISDKKNLVSRPKKMHLDNKKIKKLFNIKKINIYNQLKNI